MKFFLCLLSLLLLVSCSNTLNVTYEVEQLDSKAYALNIETNEIMCVNVDYVIDDAYDSFYLYTIFQNYLPIGFTTPGHVNITLIDCYEKANGVYYVVDNFIFMVNDLDKFKIVLSKTNQLYGMEEAFFIFNDKIIS